MKQMAMEVRECPTCATVIMSSPGTVYRGHVTEAGSWWRHQESREVSWASSRVRGQANCDSAGVGRKVAA